MPAHRNPRKLLSCIVEGGRPVGAPQATYGSTTALALREAAAAAIARLYPRASDEPLSVPVALRALSLDRQGRIENVKKVIDSLPQVWESMIRSPSAPRP